MGKEGREGRGGVNREAGVGVGDSDKNGWEKGEFHLSLPVTSYFCKTNQMNHFRKVKYDQILVITHLKFSRALPCLGILLVIHSAFMLLFSFTFQRD